MGLVVEVGLDRLHGAAGFGGEAPGQGLQAIAVAGYQDQVVAALGEPISIYSADAR